MPRPEDEEAPTLPRDPTVPDPVDAGAAATIQAPPGSADGGSATPLAIAATGTRYVLGRVLGRGGMGEVRLARDPRVDRDVAVKVMRDGAPPPEAIARFLREARVQGRLEHPAVVPVHDLGLDERGAPYFAMKRLAGTTLADAIEAVAAGDAAARERWPRRLLLDRLADICLAIEFAHERGVVHRDLKPSNIMLGDHGEAYVLDWGIARVGGETGAIPRNDLAALPTDTGAGAPTAAGALLGTPGYMAPEQMRGEPVDHRADVYALGCVLFEILTLVPALPRGAEAFEATLAAPAHRPRARHPETDVPPELDDACARATAPALVDRTGSARELAAAIRAYLDGDRDVARRRELARSHADAGARALALGDAGRAEAMSEGGRALALDPGCADAQRLLAQLMLTPPTTPVPAVQAAVQDERRRTGRIQLRIASHIYAGFLLLVPSMLLIGVRVTWPLVALGALIVVNLCLTAWGARQERTPLPAIYLAVANHAANLALTGVLFGPLLILPAIAVGSVAGFTSFPNVRKPLAIVGAHLVAVAIPFALELGGLVPRTFSVDAGTLVLHPWAPGVTGARLVLISLVAVVVQIVSTAIISVHQRDSQEHAQEQVHLHKWHLDQLLPEAARR